MRDNILKDVYKAELSTMNVKLGMIQDFENESNQIIELAKKDIAKVLDVLNTAKFQIEVLNEIPRRTTAILKKYQDLQIKSKEFGIAIPNNLQNIVKQIDLLSKININKLDTLIKSATAELNK